VGHSTRGGREAGRIKEEKTKVISSPAAHPGEEGGTVSLKTTLFCSLLFLHETMLFWTKRAVSFK
jgi:hypothetical protein